MNEQRQGMQAPRTKRRWRWRGSRFLQFILRLLVLAILLNLIWLGISRLALKPVVARWGTVSQGCWVEALFLREESLITAPASGWLTAKLDSGTRVPQGATLARLVVNPRIKLSQAEQDRLTAEQAQLHDTILSLEQELAGLNETISLTETKLAATAARSRAARRAAEDLSRLKQEKEARFRSIQDSRSRIQVITAKLAEARGYNNLISATRPGYVFFEYDGAEKVLTPDNLDRIGREEWESNYRPKRLGNRVRLNEPIAKVISPFRQVILVKVAVTEIPAPEVGGYWWVQTGTGLTKFPIIAVKPQTAEWLLVALEDPVFLNDYLPQRRSRIYLVYRRYSGVTVPLRAIYHQGNRTLIRVAKGDGYREKTVRVLADDGAQAIITGIEFGTTIIIR